MTEQGSDSLNHSSHKRTIVQTFTLDEYEDVKRRAYKAGLDAAREAVTDYANETHQHVGIQKCWPESGDRCDITAALRAADQRIKNLGGKP